MHLAHGLLLIKHSSMVERGCNWRIMGQYDKGALQQID
jgi:hypothetical protein